MRSHATVGLAFCVCSLPTALAESSHLSSPPTIVANDNRTPAGHLKNGVLELRLELREGVWSPEADSGGHRDVYVFAEEGRPLQSPGPLIRVPQGTQIRAHVRNTLPIAAKVYGLHRHPGDSADAVSVGPGESRDVQFSAGGPGTYLYWAAISDHSLDTRDDAETMLSGAFVVDSSGAKPDDRIFVLGLWSRGELTAGDEIPSINGKSWPFDEHVTYRTGETIHWRVINPTGSPHAMHLHGFYFDVDAVGDGERYERYANDQRRHEVTELIEEGHVFDMTWKAERAGNWLFHCHMVAHMSPPNPLHPPVAAPASYSPDHDHGTMMGGLVIGITVLPNANAAPAPLAPNATHRLQLVISDNPERVPLYKLQVNDLTAPTLASDAHPPPSLLGPPIVLTRGETAEIEVKNQTSTPTSIHWHGIEIESYYDGVVGWTGTDQHPSPAIAPGGSFVVRMTPPRAGTFIYHTHWHDPLQIRNALYGPLIVLEPGQKYDPEHDRTFVFGLGKYAPFGFLLLANGNPEPGPVTLHVGTRYRLRLINITSNAVDMRVRLTSNDAPVQWNIIAKDGADLPPAQLKTSTADMWLTVGETYDVEYQVASPILAKLEAWEVGYPWQVVVPLQFVASK
jgi:FtsP/CotA-like multicopper oxidase with cupredoxin domain